MQVKYWIFVALFIIQAFYFLDDFGPGKKMGQIENEDITEASGLVASYKNPGILWTHNDRGNQNRIFAIDTNGQDISIITLEGIDNRDWEDIAIGEDPSDNQIYIYIADIGDNNSEYDVKYIYRFVEPEVNNTSIVVNSSSIETISFSYPDGNRDAETLLFDSYTADLYIITKRDSLPRLYRLPYPQSTFGIISAELVDYIIFPNNTYDNIPYNYITGGDISRDGTEILIKSYQSIYYWKRNTEENIKDILLEQPVELPYNIEPQGEAICWENFGSNGYFTTSEEDFEINGVSFTLPAELYYYERLSPTGIDKNELKNVISLKQNYPNPFNPTTEIEFSIPQEMNNSKVELSVFDLTGSEIEKLVNKNKQAGIYKVQFNSTNYSAGVYFYRLQIKNYSITKKMIVLK